MRKAAFLRKRYQYILSGVCKLLCLFGGLMLLPLAGCLLWPYAAGDFRAFALPAAVTIGFGALGWLARRGPREELTMADGGVVVFLAWLGASVAGAMPFLLASTRLSFSHAVFETVSGLSTTGLSLVDVTTASHAILFWRSFLQIIGGAGLAIVMMATLVGPSSPAVTAAEGRGDQLVPHVRQSARRVVALCAGYVFLGVVGYMALGLTAFDAITHAFTAVATGGFSTYPDSIGHWDSAAVEGVTIVLMLLGNLNFVTVWVLLTGNVRAFARNGEIRFLVFILAGSALALFVATTHGIYPTLGRAVRAAVFESVSALTGTGFTSISAYAGWNPFGLLVLTLLMVIGGGACSTSGALKQFRVYVLLKTVYWEIRRALLPQRAVMSRAVWEGDRKNEITPSRLHAIAGYSFLYLATWFLGSLILTVHGYPIGDSLFEYASAQGGVGCSLGITSPQAPLTLIWTETVGMFLGRLEFFVVFVSVAKLFRALPRMAGFRGRMLDG